jgi:hypothetical protein
MGGAVAGGTVTWLLTRDTRPASGPPAPTGPKPSASFVTPTGGVIGASATPTGSVPAYGVGVRGIF